MEDLQLEIEDSEETDCALEEYVMVLLSQRVCLGAFEDCGSCGGDKFYSDDRLDLLARIHFRLSTAPYAFDIGPLLFSQHKSIGPAQLQTFGFQSNRQAMSYVYQLWQLVARTSDQKSVLRRVANNSALYYLLIKMLEGAGVCSKSDLVSYFKESAPGCLIADSYTKKIKQKNKNSQAFSPFCLALLSVSFSQSANSTVDCGRDYSQMGLGWSRTWRDRVCLRQTESRRMSRIDMNKYLQLTYSVCKKEGLHEGEFLHQVCQQAGCRENPLLCLFCASESHQGHKLVSLKMLANEALKNARKCEAKPKDLRKLNQIIDQLEQEALQDVQQLKARLLAEMEEVAGQFTEYFRWLRSQLLLEDKEFEVSEETVKGLLDPASPHLQLNVQRLLNLSEQPQTVELPENYVIDIFKQKVKLLVEEGRSLLVGLKGKSDKLQKLLKEDRLKSVWTVGSYFSFSVELKHPQISIVSPSVVKSHSSNSYKIAVLRNDVEFSPKFSCEFRVREVGSAGNNWVAVGLCHRKTVEDKKFTFLNSSTGHGCYMVSSNGGSWSSSSPEHNNVVKVFKYGLGDTILLRNDLAEETVTFTKKATGESYALKYSARKDDPLHPCVLFFFVNDVVEFVPLFP